MIQKFLVQDSPMVAAVGLLLAFALTCMLLTKLSSFLPKDAGRAFAHDGSLSAGKPRGAGIIFVLVFIAAAILFAPVSVETMIYLMLIAGEMLTGYMDDAAEHPWNEYKKGLLDLIIAIILAVTYLNHNESSFTLATMGITGSFCGADSDTGMDIDQCDKLCRWCGWSFRYTGAGHPDYHLCDRWDSWEGK